MNAKLIITEATMALIRAQTLPGRDFKQTATRLADGRWEWSPDPELVGRIDAERRPGETDDDALARIILAATGQKPH